MKINIKYQKHNHYEPRIRSTKEGFIVNNECQTKEKNLGKKMHFLNKMRKFVLN